MTLSVTGIVRLGLDALWWADADKLLVAFGRKKTCYPNPIKINTIIITSKQMQYSYNNDLKQVLKACSRQGIRVFNGTND